MPLGKHAGALSTGQRVNRFATQLGQKDIDAVAEDEVTPEAGMFGHSARAKLSSNAAALQCRRATPAALATATRAGPKLETDFTSRANAEKGTHTKTSVFDNDCIPKTGLSLSSSCRQNSEAPSGGCCATLACSSARKTGAAVAVDELADDGAMA